MNPMRTIKINFLTAQENERMNGPTVRRFRRFRQDDYIHPAIHLEIMVRKIYGKKAWFCVDMSKPHDASTWYGRVYRTLPGSCSTLVSGNIRVDFS